MKKPFKILPEDLMRLSEIGANLFLTDAEYSEQVNVVWVELGQKYGFVWESAKQIIDNIDPLEMGLHWMAEPLTKKDFAEVHAETVHTVVAPNPAMDDDYHVKGEVQAPAVGVNKNELTVYIANSGIEKPDQEKLNLLFLPFFDQAQGWMAIAKTLVVTSEDQVAEMKKADNARLALKSIRGAIERTRKQIKEYSINYGRAVDGVAKKLTEAIQPIEDYLYDQAKYGEIQELKRKQKLGEDRLVELQQYDFQYSTGFHLDEMDEEMYANLLAGCKLAYENRIAQERQAEQDKAEEERKRQLENDRIDTMGKLIVYVPDESIPPYWSDLSQEEFNNILSAAQQAKTDHETEVAKAQEEAAKAQAKMVKNIQRNQRIAKQGIISDGKGFYVGDIQLAVKSTLDELTEMEDADFEESFAGLVLLADEAKEILQRKQELAQRKNNREAVLKSRYYKPFEKDWVWQDKKGFNFQIIRASHFELPDNLWDDLIADQAEKIKAKIVEETPPPPPPEPVRELKIADMEKIQEEKATKQVSLRSEDATRLVAYVHQLNELELPKMTSAEGKKFIIEVRSKLDALVTFIENRLL